MPLIVVPRPPSAEVLQLGWQSDASQDTSGTVYPGGGAEVELVVALTVSMLATLVDVTPLLDAEPLLPPPDALTVVRPTLPAAETVTAETAHSRPKAQAKTPAGLASFMAELYQGPRHPHSYL